MKICKIMDEVTYKGIKYYRIISGDKEFIVKKMQDDDYKLVDYISKINLFETKNKYKILSKTVNN